MTWVSEAPRHLEIGQLSWLASLVPFSVGFPSQLGLVTTKDRGTSGHVPSEDSVLVQH